MLSLRTVAAAAWQLPSLLRGVIVDGQGQTRQEPEGRGEGLAVVDRPASISTLIREHPMCLECIAKTLVASLEATQTALTVIQRAIDIHRQEAAPCRACGETKVVFSVQLP